MLPRLLPTFHRRPVPAAPTRRDRNPVLDAALAEYAALKAEQAARIGIRDNLLYIHYAAIAAVIAATFAYSHLALLLLPPISVRLGWTYLGNDRKIGDIRNYLGTRLRSVVAAQGAPGAFGWETWYVRRPGRTSRMSMPMELLAFPAPAAGTAVAAAVVGGIAPWVLIALAAEAVLIAALVRETLRLRPLLQSVSTEED